VVRRVLKPVNLTMWAHLHAADGPASAHPDPTPSA
jgi:hypothetical protein